MSFPYFNLYTRDFRDGVRGMKPDEVGAYILVLTLIYDYEGKIPDDDVWVSSKIDLDVRAWRRLRGLLVERGKLIAKKGKLSNKRADGAIAERGDFQAKQSERGKVGGVASGKSRRKNIADTSPTLPGEIAETSQTHLRDVSEKLDEKSNVVILLSEAKAEAEASPLSKEVATLSSVATPPLERPVDRCLAAGGPGLGDPKKYGSLHMSAPRIAAAIAGGCDLELDILPIIAARTAKARPKPIVSWDYFVPAWMEARDLRLATIATPDPARIQELANVQHSTVSATRNDPASQRSARRRAALEVLEESGRLERVAR